jgi:hypothetical protein
MVGVKMAKAASNPGEPTPKSAPKLSDKYTAVVFVHGMGRQAQYENVGRLLEALEDYSSEPLFGVLRSFKARTEPSRSGGPDVPFVQFDRFEQRIRTGKTLDRWAFKSRFRAYEAYWSPLTARGAPPLRVALWALHQLARPRQILEDKWRHFTRLRIARLHRLISQPPRPTEPAARRAQDYVFASLLSHIQRYRGYEGSRHQARAVEGATDAGEFANFAGKKFGDGVWRGPAQDVITRWSAMRLPIETFASGLAGPVRLLGLALLVHLAGLGFDMVRTQGVPLSKGLTLLGTGAALIGVAWVGGAFLATTFSDVFIWNSNQAHDRDYARRQEVLENTRALIEHVVADTACKRLVLVSHSLGTAIVLETLSLIGRRNEARAGTDGIVELSKLSHLFTLGSPIDKTFYFFQTREAQTYRAGRLNDDLRGNLSQEPFFRDGAPRVDWLNIWDRADLVSDPLYSPLGNLTDGNEIRSAEILNCEVENTANWSAWQSHITYLDNEDVVESIAQALFKNTTSAPRKQAPLRDQTLGRTRGWVLRWTPLALFIGAVAAAWGYGLIGLVIALGPLGWFAFKAATSGTPQSRFMAQRRRASLKARSLVASPSGD